MNCGICDKKVKKLIKIDDIIVCHICRKIWIAAFNKLHN